MQIRPSFAVITMASFSALGRHMAGAFSSRSASLGVRTAAPAASSTARFMSQGSFPYGDGRSCSGV